MAVLVRAHRLGLKKSSRSLIELLSGGLIPVLRHLICRQSYTQLPQALHSLFPAHAGPSCVFPSRLHRPHAVNLELPSEV